MRKTWQKMKGWFGKLCRWILNGERILIGIAVLVGGGLIAYLYFESQKYDPLHVIGAGGTRNLILLLAGAIGWYFLLRRTTTAEQGVVTDRLANAMTQLAHGDSYIRLGGILGLEQIAESQKEDRRKIARILVAFIRKRDDKYPSEDPRPENESDRAHRNALIIYRSDRLDMEAAVNALAGIAAKLTYSEQYNERKRHLCDLYGVDLRGLRFVDANLSGFDLKNSNLSGAWLRDADLSGAWLRHADLSGAWLKGADCRGAYFSDTNFRGVKDLTQEQLDQAFADEDAPPRNLPDGLKPPPPPPPRTEETAATPAEGET